MSSAVHLLTVQDSGGQRRQAVLRRYVRPELNADEPDITKHQLTLRNQVSEQDTVRGRDPGPAPPHSQNGYMRASWQELA
jgi:hypothetical protein